MEAKIQMIPVGLLYPHPQNPRLDVGDVSELAESIKRSGIMQNLTVVRGHEMTDDEYRQACEEYRRHPTADLQQLMNKRKMPNGYTVIIGHRRLAASKLAGLTELPCSVVEMSEADQMATMLAENMQRNDLTLFEQVNGMSQMIMQFGETVETVSEKTGLSKSAVRRRVKYSALNGELFKRKAADGQITMKMLDELMAIEDIRTREKLLDYAGTDRFDGEMRKAEQEQYKQEFLKLCEKAAGEHGLLKVEYCQSGYRQCGYVYQPERTKAPDEKKIIEQYNEICKDSKPVAYAIQYGTMYLYEEQVVTFDGEAERKKYRMNLMREFKVDAEECRDEIQEEHYGFIRNLKVTDEVRAEAFRVLKETMEKSKYDYDTISLRHDQLRTVLGGEEKVSGVDADRLLLILAFVTLGGMIDVEVGTNAWNDFPKYRGMDDREKALYEWMTGIGYKVKEFEADYITGQGDFWPETFPGMDASIEEMKAWEKEVLML